MKRNKKFFENQDFKCVHEYRLLPGHPATYSFQIKTLRTELVVCIQNALYLCGFRVMCMCM
jgi:hypothetical protein